MQRQFLGRPHVNIVLRWSLQSLTPQCIIQHAESDLLRCVIHFCFFRTFFISDSALYQSVRSQTLQSVIAESLR